MSTFGLIGYPLGHSFSKKYFTSKFEREGIEDCRYELFPVEHIAAVTELIASNPDLRGLNVTIPYKVAVLPFLQETEAAAKAIGAVNCIAVSREGGRITLKGYNTDAYGFSESLKPLLGPQHTAALILGDGGAARAVKYVLDTLQISWKSVVRKPEEHQLGYAQLDEAVLQQHRLIINTSPVGTFPDIDAAPAIPYPYLGPEHLLYDLVYNPEMTAFLKQGKARGAAVKNGLEMLRLQAERSWTIWNT